MKFGEQVAMSTMLGVAAIFGPTSAAWKALEDAKQRTKAGQNVEFRRGTGRYREFIFVVAKEV